MTKSPTKAKSNVVPLPVNKAEDEDVVKLTMDISPKMPVKDKKTGKLSNPNKTTANNPVSGYVVTLNFTGVSRAQLIAIANKAIAVTLQSRARMAATTEGMKGKPFADCVKETLPAHMDVLKSIVEQARGQNPVNKEKRFNTMKKSVDMLTDEQKAEMLALLTKNDAKATSKALRK
jgi:hypothetical protein